MGVKGAVFVAFVAAALFAAPLARADTTRPDYVAQAEAICAQTGNAENAAARKVLKGHKPPKHPTKKQAKAFFRTLGKAIIATDVPFRAGIDQIAGLSQPTADATVLEQWIGAVRAYADASLAVGRLYKRGKLIKAFSADDQLTKQAKSTDAIVAGFGFNNCLLSTSPAL
jgi:hypothetical protein